jgi:hypothetical protein
MSATVFVGSWLINYCTPSEKNIEVSQSLLITGLEMPEPPTLSRVLLAYDPDGLMIGILVPCCSAIYQGRCCVISAR